MPRSTTLKIFPQQVILKKTSRWFDKPIDSVEIQWGLANYGKDAMPRLSEPIDPNCRWTWIPVRVRRKVVFYFKSDVDAIAFKLAVG